MARETRDASTIEPGIARRKRTIAAMEQGETFVKETLTTADISPVVVTEQIPDPFKEEEASVPVRSIQGELVPYTRVADLAPSLDLVNLEQIQGYDLLLWRYDKWHSAENDADFLTLEVSHVNSADQHFLTNCGGQDAMAKIINAFKMVEEGKAVAPLVASFRKIATGNGRSFWVVS